jgi:hypothetical protein
MNTLNTAPAALLNTTTRIAIALAVTASVALAWVGAERSSHEAVDLTTAQLSREVTRIHLPTVVVVGQREVLVAAAQPGTL